MKDRVLIACVGNIFLDAEPVVAEEEIGRASCRERV